MSDDTYLFGREIDGKVYVPFEDVRPMLNRRDEEIERLREMVKHFACHCHGGCDRSDENCLISQAALEGKE